MAQFYRVYVTNGEDSQTIALVWADSDGEALGVGLEEISGVRYRLLKREWDITPELQPDDDGASFFTTLDVLEEARGLVLIDGKDGTIAENLSELLGQYLEELAPTTSAETRGEITRQLRNEILEHSTR